MDSMACHYGIAPSVPVGRNLAPWAHFLDRAARAILRVVEAHAESRRKRGTLAELGHLTDRELRDIGLTRADLDLMAISRN